MTLVASSLDDFNRPDAANLGPNWSPGHEESPAIRHLLSGNAAVPPGSGGPVIDWWIGGVADPRDAAPFGPDCEFQMELNNMASSGSYVNLLIRLLPPSPTYPYHMDYGYWLTANYSEMYLIKIVLVGGIPDTITLTGPDSISLTNTNAAVAIRCIGNTISGHARADAGSSWVEVASVTDTTYPDAGYVGFRLGDGLSATATWIAEDVPVVATGPIDINRRLLAVSSATVEAIDLNSPLYH